MNYTANFLLKNSAVNWVQKKRGEPVGCLSSIFATGLRTWTGSRRGSRSCSTSMQSNVRDILHIRRLKLTKQLLQYSSRSLHDPRRKVDRSLPNTELYPHSETRLPTDSLEIRISHRWHRGPRVGLLYQLSRLQRLQIWGAKSEFLCRYPLILLENVRLAGINGFPPFSYSQCYLIFIFPFWI